MSFYRKTCRKPNQQLQQIARRKSEKDKIAKKIINISNQTVIVDKMHSNGPTLMFSQNTCKQFSRIRYRHLDFSLHKSDNCCIVNNGTIYIIDNIISVDSFHFLCVRNFNVIQNVFDVGIKSSTVGVYKCSKLSEIRNLVSIECIKSKCYRMPTFRNYENICTEVVGEYVIVEMLHTQIEQYFANT